MSVQRHTVWSARAVRLSMASQCFEKISVPIQPFDRATIPSKVLQKIIPGGELGTINSAAGERTVLVFVSGAIPQNIVHCCAKMPNPKKKTLPCARVGQTLFPFSFFSFFFPFFFLPFSVSTPFHRFCLLLFFFPFFFLVFSLSFFSDFLVQS